MKTLYFDVETTGLRPFKNEIVQLSGIIEIDGVVKETFNLRAKPEKLDTIQDSALKVIGFTKEELANFGERRDMYDQVIDLFDKYVNKFDKNDKFTPVGYNVSFDMGFLRSFFLEFNDKFLGSYIYNGEVDVLQLVNILQHKGIIETLENRKLETLCRFHNIEINAHDALSDIEATRELYLSMSKYFAL